MINFKQWWCTAQKALSKSKKGWCATEIKESPSKKYKIIEKFSSALCPTVKKWWVIHVEINLFFWALVFTSAFILMLFGV
ncbi:MAG: hypothetical protein ACRCST_13520 [Turicibacter sp.]